jgi:hypothetical protein
MANLGLAAYGGNLVVARLKRNMGIDSTPAYPTENPSQLTKLGNKPYGFREVLRRSGLNSS